MRRDDLVGGAGIQITVRLPRALLAELKARGGNRSEVVRRLLEQALQKKPRS